MFVDYYSLLGVNPDANASEIQRAFKEQALKWHPDRNIGKDTTERMQQLNEARLILLDTDARERYNKQYEKFRSYQKQERSHTEFETKANRKTKDHSEKEFEVDDEILNKWMNNARRQSVDLAKQTIKDLKGMIAVGSKEAVKAGTSYFIFYAAATILLFVAFRACH